MQRTALKIQEYATEIKTILKNGQFGTFPATLEKSRFPKPHCRQTLLRIKQTQNVQNMLQTPKTLKNLWFELSQATVENRLLQGPTKSSHHASYTTQICRISYRQRAQYNSDDERCCEQLLKSHFLLTHLSPVMLQQLIKDPLFKWPTIQKFGHELHRLLKSWISQGHQKHKKAADLRRSAPLLRNGVFLWPTLKKIHCVMHCP